MGTEAAGTLKVGGQTVKVRGDFGSDRVLFSGGRRGTVSYKDIQVLGTTKGKLRLRVDDAVMEFDVGSAVDRLANKIRAPPSRLDKMGAKKGMRAAVVEGDEVFVAELRSLIPDAVEGIPDAPVDLLVFGVESAEQLDGIGRMGRHIKEDGGLWVVYPKSRRELPERMVLDVGRAAGLKDVKAMRFTESHTAIKFVIPFADREA